jgi:hypothetical protein
MYNHAGIMRAKVFFINKIDIFFSMKFSVHLDVTFIIVLIIKDNVIQQAIRLVMKFSS